MEKQIEFGAAAREKFKNGAKILNEAVCVTLGPMGKNVIIRRPGFGSPHVTKDGVTVAKEVTLPDPLEDLGALIVREAALKTSEKAGDGTTTATLLTTALITRGMYYMGASSGSNAVKLKSGIEAAAKVAVEYIKSAAQVIKNDETYVKNVATISANNDEEIGALIAEGMSKIGEEGTIAIEDSQSTDTRIDVVDGMQLKRGYVSPYFVMDTEKMSTTMEKPYVLCCDSKLSSMQEIIPTLEMVMKAGASIVIFADEIEGDALSALILNKVRGVLKVVAIKTPGYGQNRKDVLADICALTGAVAVCPEAGVNFENMTLGRADKIIVTKEVTTIINGAGGDDAIKSRVGAIRGQMEACNNDFEKKQCKERLARLTGGVAVLYIGAATEVEMKEKRDRVDDALHATRAAIEEGIVPGGGVIYINSSMAIDKAMGEYKAKGGVDENFISGMSIMRDTLIVPFKQIIANAGETPDVVWSKLEEPRKTNINYGYNAKTGMYVDMMVAGVIDPAKVARVVIETAASIAATILTMECVIVPEKEEPKK